MSKRKRSDAYSLPGGYKQKAKWDDQDKATSSTHSKSALAECLLHSWAWGSMSAPMVQRIASCAKADGAKHADLDKLASLGSAGAHPKNCNSELLTKLSPTPIRSTLRLMDVYIKKPPHSIMKLQHYVRWPHELFACLYQNHRDIFLESFLGGKEKNISEFWKAMADHPSYSSHPLKERADHQTRCIPFALHGDGVPVAGVGKAWSKSVEALSMSSMIGRGPTIMTHFLIFIFYAKLIVASDNLNLWKMLLPS